MDQKVKNQKNKIKKVLGGSKYSGAKKKSKTAVIVEKKPALTKDRQLKGKIKHLQKEQKRIENAIAKSNSDDPKFIAQKSFLTAKIKKLLSLQKKFVS